MANPIKLSDGHSDSILSTDCSGDGKCLIATGSEDCSARLWSTEGQSLGDNGQNLCKKQTTYN